MTDTGRYEGKAGYYSRFRPGYPTALFDLLADEASLNASSSVLDLGCGPGPVALALSPRVASVVGVDPDRGMLEEAARLATEQGRHNVRWVNDTAEGFEARPGSSYTLVVAASAFHWMDRPVVTAKVHRLLEPGGLFAVVANPTPLTLIRRNEGVGAAIAAVQDHWLDPDQFPRSLVVRSSSEEVIRDSAFGHARLVQIPTEQHWDVEGLIGFLRSTSWMSEKILGERFPEYLAQLTDAVLEFEPSGRWVYDATVEVVIARR